MSQLAAPIAQLVKYWDFWSWQPGWGWGTFVQYSGREGHPEAGQEWRGKEDHEEEGENPFTALGAVAGI